MFMDLSERAKIKQEIVQETGYKTAIKESDKEVEQWNYNTVPKCEDKTCSDEVLVTVEKYCRRTYRRVLKAVYIPYHHCTLEDMGWNMYDGVPDDWEYVEEEDTWWIPQGWYEVCDYFEDYSYSAITDKVTAWMKLPKAFKPSLKELKGK